MAEKETKQLFVNGQRMAEVWAAFLAKLALKVDKTTLEDYPTVEATATAIANALSDYISDDELATALSSYMTESQVNAAIASAIGGVSGGFIMTPVETLPAQGENNVIYLVPNGEAEGNNLRDEYIWLNGKYELIGNTAVDLSNYWSKDELSPMTQEELADILG